MLHVACWTGNLELFRAFCLDANVSFVRKCVDNFYIIFVTGPETLDPTNDIGVDSPDVCRHQRADKHRGGVLQQQELQEGHLLPQGVERHKAKQKIVNIKGANSSGCAGHKADSAVSPLPLLPKRQSKDCPQEEGPGEGGGESERIIEIQQN